MIKRSRQLTGRNKVAEICGCVRPLLRAVQEEQRQFLSRHQGRTWQCKMGNGRRLGMRGYAYTSERGSSSSPKTSSPRRATVCSCIGSLKSSSPHHLKSVQDAPERGRAVYARRKAQVIGLGFSSPHAVMRSVAFLLLSFEALEFPCGKIHHPRRGGGRLY